MLIIFLQTRLIYDSLRKIVLVGLSERNCIYNNYNYKSSHEKKLVAIILMVEITMVYTGLAAFEVGFR